MRQRLTLAAAIVSGMLLMIMPAKADDREVNQVVMHYEFFGCEVDTVIQADIMTVTIIRNETRPDGTTVASTKIALRDGHGVGHGGEIEGVPYEISGTTLDEREIIYPDGSKKFVSNHSLHLIGQGRAPNYIERLKIITWIDPEGNEVYREKSVSECR